MKRVALSHDKGLFRYAVSPHEQNQSAPIAKSFCVDTIPHGSSL